MYGSFILNSTLPITLPSNRLQQVALGKQNERAACPNQVFSSPAYILRNWNTLHIINNKGSLLVNKTTYKH